jgi:hypothetical protein
MSFDFSEYTIRPLVELKMSEEVYIKALKAWARSGPTRSETTERRDAEDMMPTMLARGASWSLTSQPATNVESSSIFHWKGMSNLRSTSP